MHFRRRGRRGGQGESFSAVTWRSVSCLQVSLDCISTIGTWRATTGDDTTTQRALLSAPGHAQSELLPWRELLHDAFARHAARRRLLLRQEETSLHSRGSLIYAVRGIVHHSVIITVLARSTQPAWQ
jgi:hypothetical protein